MISLKQRGEEMILVEVSRYDLYMIEAALLQRVRHLHSIGLYESAHDYHQAYNDVVELFEELDDIKEGGES